MHTEQSYRAGFVHLAGMPNVGKSTLFNYLVSKPLAITSPKAQTTRHTMVGIREKEGLQVIYVDTPGYLKPAYRLQAAMKGQLMSSVRGSDLLCWVVDGRQEAKEAGIWPKKLGREVGAQMVVVNKIDLLSADEKLTCREAWTEQLPEGVALRMVSAATGEGVEALQTAIQACIPTHPPYYPPGTLTDKPASFLMAEIVRKAVLDHYHQEIPYSVQVEVDAIAEEEEIIKVSAILHVERESQKKIVIGERGSALKQAATAARHHLEDFFQKRFFLKTYVKVTPGWREDVYRLREWGYI